MDFIGAIIIEQQMDDLFRARALHLFMWDVKPPDRPCLTDIGEVGIATVQHSQLAALIHAASSLRWFHGRVTHCRCDLWHFVELPSVAGKPSPPTGVLIRAGLVISALRTDSSQVVSKFLVATKHG
jgi:hypothetical protein